MVLKNQMPPNMVPNSAVQRMLAINGKITAAVRLVQEFLLCEEDVTLKLLTFHAFVFVTRGASRRCRYRVNQTRWDSNAHRLTFRRGHSKAGQSVPAHPGVPVPGDHIELGHAGNKFPEELIRSETEDSGW